MVLLAHRNRWFTKLNSMDIFHGYVSHNQMVILGSGNSWHFLGNFPKPHLRLWKSVTPTLGNFDQEHAGQWSMINHRIVGPRTNMYLEHPEKKSKFGVVYQIWRIWEDRGNSIALRRVTVLSGMAMNDKCRTRIISYFLRGFSHYSTLKPELKDIRTIGHMLQRGRPSAEVTSVIFWWLFQLVLLSLCLDCLDWSLD